MPKQQKMMMKTNKSIYRQFGAFFLLMFLVSGMPLQAQILIDSTDMPFPGDISPH